MSFFKNFLGNRVVNPIIQQIVQQYLNPDSIANYLITIVNNALDPNYKKDWEKVVSILLLCRQKDPEFIGKLRKVLLILNNLLDEIEGETK